MSREQRRQAEREQRRRNRRSSAGAPTPPPVRPGEPEVLQGVLQELGRRKPTPAPTTGGAGRDRDTAPEAPSSPVPTPHRPSPAEGPDTVTTAASLSATLVGCGAVENVDPQALGMTYAFDAADDGEPYPLTIRFEGRRTDVEGEPGPQDTFSVVETIDVVPGSGKVTITKRIENIAAGTWAAAAAPVRGPAAGPVHPVPASARTSGATGFAPIIRVRAPGVRIGAWPSLVGTGAVVALTVQALLAARIGLPTTPVLLLSLLACLIGLVGARLYYVAEHPQRRRGLMSMSTGMCIQGFVLAAVGTVVVGALILGLPVGRLVDVTAPGLMFGQAIGRVGCFLGGCCAGRPTRSRIGLWSSDRRLGVRRIPTQLFESIMAFAIGLTALVIMATIAPDPGGVVFVAVIAAYTLGRQLLFPLRNLPRNTANGRVLTMVLCGVVLVVAVVWAVLG